MTTTPGPDFHEDDEPLADILAILAREPDAVTAPPPGWTGPVRRPGETIDG